MAQVTGKEVTMRHDFDQDDDHVRIVDAFTERAMLHDIMMHFDVSEHILDEAGR